MSPIFQRQKPKIGWPWASCLPVTRSAAAAASRADGNEDSTTLIHTHSRASNTGTLHLPWTHPVAATPSQTADWLTDSDRPALSLVFNAFRHQPRTVLGSALFSSRGQFPFSFLLSDNFYCNKSTWRAQA